MNSNSENRLSREHKTSIVDIYHAMQLLPLQFTRIIENYVKDIASETRHYESIKSDNDSRKSRSEQELNNKRSQRKRALQSERNAQMAERAELINRSNSIIQDMMNENKTYLEFGNLLRHKNARGRLYDQIVSIMRNHDMILDSYDILKREVENDLSNYIDETYYKKEEEIIEGEFNIGVSALLANYVNDKKKIEDEHTRKVGLFRDGLIEQINRLGPEKIKEDRILCQLKTPSNDGFMVAKEMPEIVNVATCVLDMTRFNGNEEASFAAETIYNYFDFSAEMKKGRRYLTFPYGQSFSSESFNKLIEFDFESRNAALSCLTAIEMRLFQSIPSGKLRVTMFDPIDLGKNFALFSVLGEYDDRIISTRIWHEAGRMKEKLNDLVNQISHVNQDCLKGIYNNIVDYNRAIGKNAEPLQALFVADFSSQYFDDECCRLLNQILQSGPKCGVYCFIAGTHDALESGLGRDNTQKVDRFIFRHGRMSLNSNTIGSMDLLPISLPESDQRKSILQILNEGIKNSGRITIDYNEASDDLLLHKEKWFQYMSGDDGISIPIGIEGANKIVEVCLGGVDRTQHHMLVSGTIGSGKSTFLHTFIMSTLLRYSPEDVQIYLLDFKKGVEFKIYSEYQLPNFKLISTDTTAEYGLAVLKHLCDEQARIESTLFKQENISLIEEYNEKHPNEKISRKLLIIDEFHEMFINSESEVAKECHKYLQQLVKQGRAWGVYVILASQKLPESCSDIYHQMLNRIALQSTEEVAKMILDGDNLGVSMLAGMDVGNGIFNDNGGNKDSNRIFRVAYFSRNQLKDTLEQIKRRQEELGIELTNDGDDMVLIDVNNLSDLKNHPLTRFVRKGILPEKRSFGCPLYFAKGLSLTEEFEIGLCADDYQNLLVIGPEDQRIKRIMGISAMSILLNAVTGNDGVLPKNPVITYFDFSGKQKNFGTYDIMNELSASYPKQIRVFGRESVLFGIEQLEKEIKEEAFERHFVMFAGLNRAKKMLSGQTYTESPRDRFVRLLDEGPAKGFNFIVWANEPETFLEFYPDALDYFDYRVGYNLQEDTFKKIFLSVFMEAGDDNNAISYSVDDGNQKIRIYDAPLKDYVDDFITHLDNCLQDD